MEKEDYANSYIITEDALRAFRALRFAARFGFQINESTLAAIPDTLIRVSGLSVERVRDELEKILLAPHVSNALNLLIKTNLANTSYRHRENGAYKQVPALPELLHLVGLEQNPKHHRFDAWDHTLAVVNEVPKDLALRWAALLHDIAKGLPGIRALNKHGELSDHGHDVAGIEMVPEILGRLKVSSAIIIRVAWLVRHHMTLPASNRKSVIKWIKRQAKNFRSKEVLADAVRQLLALRRADLLAGKVNPDLTEWAALVNVAEDVLASVPFYSSELAITGGQVAKVLGTGPQVGKFLSNLLERVQGGQLVNSADALTSALQARANRG